MEENNVVNSTVPVESISKEKGKKSSLVLFISATILVVLMAAAVVWFYVQKEANLSLISETITSIDALVTDTDGVDTGLADLSEDFLDSETASTEEIDKSITDIEDQLKELDNLDTDFNLQASDVGLE